MKTNCDHVTDMYHVANGNWPPTPGGHAGNVHGHPVSHNISPLPPQNDAKKVLANHCKKDCNPVTDIYVRSPPLLVVLGLSCPTWVLICGTMKQGILHSGTSIGARGTTMIDC